MKKTFIYNLLTILAAATVIAVICIYSWGNIYHYNAYMESDIASETLLAKVLYENGHVQPDTWQMSTAKRILSAPMLASFIYPLTGFDLNTAMGLGCSIMMIALVATMLYFGRQLGLGILESLLVILLSLVLSSPGNETQRMLYLYASYYVGHFISMFIVLGVYAGMLKGQKISIPGILITIPLAVLNGFQGTHAGMFFYMPLLGTEVLRVLHLFIKKRRGNGEEPGNDPGETDSDSHLSPAQEYVITAWVLVVSVISVVVPRFFGSYMVDGVSRNIRHAPEKFFEIVLPFFLEVLGYGRLQLLVYIFVLAALVGYVLAVRNLDKNPELFSIFPILFGVIVVILSTTFTTAEAAPRYYLMQVFVVGAGIAVLMTLYRHELMLILAALVIAYGVHSAAVFYQGLIANDISGDQELARVTQWMEENGYDYGYSTFDHANMATVLSNDRVRIRPVNSFEEMEGAKWLSDSTWYPPAKDASTPVCYVVSEPRLEEFDKFLDREEPKILEKKEFGYYVVYVTDHDYTIWVD